MTTLTGTIQNGVVVLDGEPSLPNGTKVEVIVTPSEPASTEKPGENDPGAGVQPGPHAWLLEFAGKATDLPADFAEQHDHYIHGTPRQ